MDGQQTGSPPPVPRPLGGGPRTAPNPVTDRLADSCFGTPILFDLTTVRDVEPPAHQEPTVYYLAMLPPPRPEPFPWRTVVGFGSVVLGGIGLGLLLATLLLPI